MTDQTDPLTPSSLAAVPEVRAAYDAVDELFHDFHRRCTVGAERLDALIAAVRDATLKAHREQLLALTPEAVVEAAERAGIATGCSCGQSPCQFPRQLRAALPVLVGPERAKREQAEADLREELGEHADTIRDEEKATERYIRAEAERDRLREALEKAEGIASRFVKARDAFHYDNFGGEVERHLERAMEDAYGFLHGLPDDLRAALGGSNG